MGGDGSGEGVSGDLDKLVLPQIAYESLLLAAGEFRPLDELEVLLESWVGVVRRGVELLLYLSLETTARLIPQLIELMMGALPPTHELLVLLVVLQ